MYLKKMAPELCERVELYNKRMPLFDEYKIEDEINGILSKRCDTMLSSSCIIATIDVACTLVWRPFAPDRWIIPSWLGIFTIKDLIYIIFKNAYYLFMHAGTGSYCDHIRPVIQAIKEVVSCATLFKKNIYIRPVIPYMEILNMPQIYIRLSFSLCKLPQITYMNFESFSVNLYNQSLI